MVPRPFYACWQWTGVRTATLTGQVLSNMNVFSNVHPATRASLRLATGDPVAVARFTIVPSLDHL